MERVRWIKHKGRDILFLDLTNVKDGELESEVAKEALFIIKGQPPKSVLTLIDYTGMRLDAQGIGAQRRYSSGVKPHVRASAVVGIDSFKKVIFKSVVRITGRKINIFPDLESAKDWLAKQ